MKVLAIDPGLTTGLAWRLDDGTWSTMNCTEHMAVWRMVRSPMYAWDHVILEDYAGQLISKEGLQTLRIIGGVQDACDAANIPLTMEWPTERRWKLTDAAALLKGQGATPHQKDALAHLLNWEAKHGATT